MSITSASTSTNVSRRQMSIIGGNDGVSSSASRSTTNPVRPRYRGTQDPAYNFHLPEVPAQENAVQEVSKYPICSRPDGASLQLDLVRLARLLLEFDMMLCRRVHSHNNKRVSSTTEQRRPEASLSIEDFHAIRTQSRDVLLDQRHFDPSYLSSDKFLPIWAEGMRIVEDTLNRAAQNSNEQTEMVQKQYQDIVQRYDRQARDVQMEMLEVARLGLLERGTIEAIQARWIHLDRTLGRYYERQERVRDEDTPSVQRVSTTWSEFRQLLDNIDPVTPRISDEKTIFQHESRSTFPRWIQDRTTRLWWMLFIGGAISLISSAVGFAYSRPSKGSTKDAEFWFLVQSTTMQLLGLGIAALLEWREDAMPKHRWAVPAAIACFLAVLAVPLYLMLPTKWSSLACVIASGLQPFLMLQHFSASKSRAKSGADMGVSQVSR